MKLSTANRFPHFIFILFFSATVFFSSQVKAQGTWIPLTNQAPDYNAGVMLLLSDGTVMVKTSTGGFDGIGNTWDKLTPDTMGSYVNGTWTTLSPMHDTRLYFASQILRDGRVFVAGGEYGTGGSLAEVYNPLTDSWTMTPNQGTYFGDANSEILSDGRVLVALLDTAPQNFDTTIIYNPLTNTWAGGPNAHGSHDESAWVKLPDSSILFVDILSINSERYIPSLNKWVVDATVPDSLYDNYDGESGAGFLLPDGRAFFLGSSGHTAYYTPSGNVSPGSWSVGPDIPNAQGTPDAAAAMMVNGKILCAVSPTPKFSGDYPSPTSFYEYNYFSNSFAQINAPGVTVDTLSEPCYITNMLDLPDGTVLYSDQGNNQYYVYSPGGTPLISGKPTVTNVVQVNCDTFKVTGKLFNGITEGAAYGDDWQMATNYPIVRITNGTYVYYMRSFNWNSTGVQRGNLPDSTLFTPPVGLVAGTYSLVVTANGNASNSVSFVYTPCTAAGIAEIKKSENVFSVYPNPTSAILNVTLKQTQNESAELRITNLLGEEVISKTDLVNGNLQIDVSYLRSGIYFVEVRDWDQKTIGRQKIIVQH